MSAAPPHPFRPVRPLPANELSDLKPVDPCSDTGNTAMDSWSARGSSGCWYWEEKQTERGGKKCLAGFVGIDSVADRRPMQSAEPNEADWEAC